MRFQKYAFSFLWKTYRSIRFHTTVSMRFQLSAQKLSKTWRKLHPRRLRGSQSGQEKRRDAGKFKTTGPWVPTLTELFPKIQTDAGSWLGTKNSLYYCAQSANSFSWVPFVSSYTTTTVSITPCMANAPEKCTQSGNFQFDIKSPSAGLSKRF